MGLFLEPARKGVKGEQKSMDIGIDVFKIFKRICFYFLALNIYIYIILYQVGRLGFTGFILQGEYWIIRGLLAQG